MAGCHAAPEGKGSLCCDTARIDAVGTGIRPQCVCRQRGCACGVATAWQSSFSQLRLSENRRKQFFHFQQRSTLHATSSSTLSNSTNRWLTWQRRSFSEDRRYLRLRIHRYVKTCYFIGDLRWWPVEIECITAGKSVRLQQELCGHRRTLLSRRRFRSLR